MKQLFLLFLSFCTLTLSAQGRYLVPVFDQVTVNKDIEYGKNATVLAVPSSQGVIVEPLLLDLYQPVDDTVSVRPLVLVLHGGYFLPSLINRWCDGTKDDSVVVEICTRLAKMGYLAAAVEYRIGWDPFAFDQTARLHGYFTALYRGIQDARTAIRYFKKTAVQNANPFRVDTTRVVLWGESTGGQIALGAAYTNSPGDWTTPNLMLPSNLPAVNPSIDGNIWGTDVGIVPAGYPYGIPAGDTLCYPNWPGYSSDFQLCVGLAASIFDVSWVNEGEMPAVLFHAPKDIVQPCGGNPLSVGALTNFVLIDAMGSCAVAEQLDFFGNNQVFKDAQLNDLSLIHI